MLARTVTHALVGLDARRVEVEAHLQNGLPAFSIVGLADRACQEAKERVRSGIASAELEWPLRRITVNLAPAGLRKEGSGFDLPIALSILAASGQIPRDRLAEHAAVGDSEQMPRIRLRHWCRRSGLQFSDRQPQLHRKVTMKRALDPHHGGGMFGEHRQRFQVVCLGTSEAQDPSKVF